jgi:mannose-6-phosphate isomerase-like protein (cupin superfamily)
MREPPFCLPGHASDSEYTLAASGHTLVTKRASTPGASEGGTAMDPAGETRAVGAFVLRPGEGRDIDLGGFSMVVKASADETQGAFSLLQADEPPGFGPPLHIHHDAAEAFFVVSGEYRIFVGDDDWVCPAGSFIYIPAGLPHGFQVGSVQSSKLNFYTPAAMVGYFDDLSTALSTDTADGATLTEIAQRYAMEVVGPVPEGYL